MARVMNVHHGRLSQCMHSFKLYNLISNIWSTSASAELDPAANTAEGGIKSTKWFFFCLFVFFKDFEL